MNKIVDIKTFVERMRKTHYENIENLNEKRKELNTIEKILQWEKDYKFEQGSRDAYIVLQEFIERKEKELEVECNI